MTFVYHDRSWKCNDGSDFPQESKSHSKDFTCNIILNKDACLERKKKGSKRGARENRKKLLERLENLAKPKKNFHDDSEMKSFPVPLVKLLPRLSDLAQPRYVTPKYKKPKEEPYPLPGKVQDWEAHNRWLEKRARPKKISSKFFKQFVIRSLARDGMQEFAKPRNKYRHCSARPRSIFNCKCNEVSTDAIKIELSQPKAHEDCGCKLDCDQLQKPKTTKSAADHQINDENLKITVRPRSILKSRESTETTPSQPKHHGDCDCLRISESSNQVFNISEKSKQDENIAASTLGSISCNTVLIERKSLETAY